MAIPNEKTPTQHDADSDLDDLLDDVLDDFNTLSTAEKKSSTAEAKQPQQQKQEPKESSESLDDMLDEDEFSKQLAANMAELMGQLDQDKEMKDTFEKIWSTFEAGETGETGTVGVAGAADPPNTSSRAVPQPSVEQSAGGQTFQEKIAQTMNKLKDSSKQVDSSIAEEGVPEDAFMAEMMRQMESLAENGEFENVLEGMMQQLMSKELLYEPLKEMAAKYPEWLKENKDKLPQAEYERYEKQHELCKQVVAKYESSSFDEKDEKQSKEIMELMQKMQDLGQPPASMLEEMAPGANLSGANLEDLENCNIM